MIEQEAIEIALETIKEMTNWERQKWIRYGGSLVEMKPIKKRRVKK